MVSQLKKRENLPFLGLFVLSCPMLGSSVDWLMPTCIGESDFLYSLANSNANLFLKQPSEHIQK